MTTTTRQTKPRKTAAARPDDLSEVEALRADLEMTRQHLADTVQELSRQLNVPRRIKDSATSAGHRAVQAAGNASQRAKATAGDMGERAKATAGGMGERAKHLPEQAKNLPAKAKQAPELGRKHPKAAAAVGGAVALGVGAWIVGRSR
ncbi:DUF3618 domain-containing protein [Kribbella italica]|uniref:Cell division septum initiation protein DivIVA n=1 Tax=Kribbella italica TaxID=1540520 RepID=A0A7W9MXQ8_9ACTN|nr:DUF3618 domain-containing protein [Kribbella italica]MBB5840044.1 cell division septum initiation protein DivIVA [Kribbella italica]